MWNGGLLQRTGRVPSGEGADKKARLPSPLATGKHSQSITKSSIYAPSPVTVTVLAFPILEGQLRRAPASFFRLAKHCRPGRAVSRASTLAIHHVAAVHAPTVPPPALSFFTNHRHPARTRPNTHCQLCSLPHYRRDRDRLTCTGACPLPSTSSSSPSSFAFANSRSMYCSCL